MLGQPIKNRTTRRERVSAVTWGSLWRPHCRGTGYRRADFPSFKGRRLAKVLLFKGRRPVPHLFTCRWDSQNTFNTL
jgi:hypothetical protein